VCVAVCVAVCVDVTHMSLVGCDTRVEEIIQACRATCLCVCVVHAGAFGCEGGKNRREWVEFE